MLGSVPWRQAAKLLGRYLQPVGELYRFVVKCVCVASSDISTELHDQWFRISLCMV